MKKFKLGLIAIIAVIMMASLTGCIRKYDTPEFVTIEPSQTAFLVPLEGKTSDQASFDSEKFLQESKVAAKRIQIPHKFVQTGRRHWKGEWMPTMRVIVVDRSAETREWTSESKQGVKVRSKDGIGFTVGVSATSSIFEEDSAKFLYRTSGSRTLASVMDSEVRNRIETKLIEEFAKRSMTDINENKGEIMNIVSKDIISYFHKERGITLSNIGYKGDIVFDDPKVQEALNAKFTAIQAQEAAVTTNQTKVDTANALIKVKEAEAKALIKESEGIAEANRKIQASLTSEVIQKQWIEKWNGTLPTYQAGNGSTMVQVPAPTK